MKLERFWKLLEELGPRTAARQYFQIRLESEYDAVESVIIRQTASGQNDLYVASYPCSVCRRSHSVECIGPDAYIAVAEDDEEKTPCPDIEGLTSDEVWPRSFDFETIGKMAATALSITPGFSRISDQIWSIGSTSNARSPVFMCARNSASAYVHATDTLLATTASNFLLLTATVQTSVANRMDKGPGRCIAMADVFEMDTKHGCTACATAERLIAVGLPSAKVAMTGSPVPLRGKQYEIAEGFSAITKLGSRKKVYLIEQRNCQEALRVLVEAGAQSKETAIDKDAWCQEVWQRRKRAKDRAQSESRPIDFFRFRRNGKIETVPWYKDVIKNDHHGMHWLEL